MVGKVEMQNSLDHLQELLAYWAMGGGQDRQDSIAKSLLFIVGDEGFIGKLLVLGPASICAVFKVDDSWKESQQGE